MKTLLKLIAVAAAFGMATPALSVVAGAPPGTTDAPDAPPMVQTPIDEISANSQARPAQPAEGSQTPASQEAPSNDQVLASSAAKTAPDATVGQPVDGDLGFQPQVTPIGEEALWFHDAILLPLIFAISLFVLALLLYVVVRYRRTAHRAPSRTTHNTLLEVVWTLVPVLILVAIAVPSIRLLAHQYSPPKADITVKATGNQWYWTYSYPDHGDFEIVSNGLSDDDAAKRGEPRLLAVDERMVVPQGAVVKVIVTSADVIHAWGIPAFWAKIDAVPGKLNETWFKTDRPGIYYGQCFELCGARHAYMPIAVEVLPPAQFAAWVASKGGTMPGATPPKGPDSTAASPVTNPQAQPAGAAPPATETTPPPTLTPGTATPAATNQAAENTRGN